MMQIDFDWAAALMQRKYGDDGRRRALRQADALRAAGQLPASLLWRQIAAMMAGAGTDAISPTATA